MGLFTVNKIRYQKQKPSLERILPKITKTTQYDEDMVKNALNEMVKNKKLLKVETKKGYSYRDPYKDPLTNFSTSNTNKYKGLQKKRVKNTNVKDEFNTSSENSLPNKPTLVVYDKEHPINRTTSLNVQTTKCEISKKDQIYNKRTADKSPIKVINSFSNQTKAILNKAKGIKSAKSRKLKLSPSKQIDLSSKKNLLSPSK